MDGCENLAPTDIRSADCPAHSKSLYRLRHSGPLCGGIRLSEERSAGKVTDKGDSLRWYTQGSARSRGRNLHSHLSINMFNISIL
jgi:hypothetical protein